MNNPPDAHENSHVSPPVSAPVSANPALAGMGGSIAGTVVGGAMSLLGNYIQQKYYERNLKSQFDYNERAADNADKRQRALYYDLYSPEAQKQMYINAGFSPSILYSGGATSSQGATPHGAQGAGANMSMPTMAPLSLNTDLALTAAQIDLMRSQARKNNVDADTQQGVTPLGEATIKQILSNVDLNNSVTALNRIEYEVQSETKDFRISIVEHNMHLIENQAENEFWNACESRLKFEFDKETFENRSKIVGETLTNLRADSALKQAEKNVADANVEKLQSEKKYFDQLVQESLNRIVQGYMEIAVQQEGVRLNYELGMSMQKNMRDLQDNELKYLREQLNQNKDLGEKSIWLGAAEQIVNTFGTVISALVIRKGLSGNPGRPVVRGFQ